ncbi:MAG: superoxide dismutase [Terriglobales bacterium]
MPYEVPALPYAYNALEPHIDEATMRLHHDKHHGAYVTNLNNALAGEAKLASLNIEDLLRRIQDVPEKIRTAVRNNGGGHANHSMFWAIMQPNGGGKPSGPLAQAIDKKFGSLEALQTAFNDAGLKRFGSGWAWLVVNKSGDLEVISTANQDSPYMEGLSPVMGNDVWEHAYYLKYQNRRGEYLNAWWRTLNWEAIGQRFAAAKK